MTRVNLRLVLTRVLGAIPVALGVCALTFLLLHVAPGDPALLYLGDKASPEALAAIREKWGLDDPLWKQFLAFLVGVAHGNLGFSISLNLPTSELVATRLPASLLLMIMGTAFGIALSLPLAAVAAAHPGGRVDSLVRVLVALVQGVPMVLLGTLLLSVLALQLGLFPVGGYGGSALDHLHSLILPALTVGVGMLPVLVRGFRSAFVDALGSENMAFAQSKGLKGFALMVPYVLRPTGVSAISLIGIQLGSLVGGVVIVENVFAFPGMGNLMLQGILARDFGLVQGVTLVLSLLVVSVFMVTDLLLALVDSRISLS